MENFVHLMKALAAIGAGGMGLLLLAIYLSYGIESHCWSPLGCIDPKQVAEQDKQDAIIRSWGHNL